MKECVQTQEDVFRLNGLGRAWNGASVYINYPKVHRTAVPYRGRMMSGSIEPDWRGTKQIHYADDVHRIQVVSLFRAEDVLPVAIVEGQYVGQCRTGAGAGVAAKYLARKGASVVGVLGTGETARFSLLAIRAVEWPVSKVYVYSRATSNRAAYASLLRERTGYAIEPLDDPEAVVRRADILVTATTSDRPVVKAEWVKPGTLVTALGQAEEIDPQLFLRARNIADEIPVALEEGHLHACIKTGAVMAGAAHASIGEVVAGKQEGRTSDDQIVIFDSSGLCIQDMAAAIHVYQKAGAQGLGTWAELEHDTPLW